MKELRISALLTFVPARGRKGDSTGKVRLSKVAFAVFVFCVAAVNASPAQTFTTLANFDGADGSYTELMTLVQGTDGNFYGTTNQGGASGFGTVFRMTPDGTITSLHSFDNTDGAFPGAGLVQARNGDFYGTTISGGANSSGTVFKITPEGNLTTLYNFCSLPECSDGLNPEGTLVQATDGHFYGTTSNYYSDQFGTVFKITSKGKLTTLHSFCSKPNCADGRYPVGGLVQAPDGDFYGTTGDGGAIGFGTVFRMTPDGTITSLHSFDNTDGELPFATLVVARDGDFYGTTLAGGPHGYGTVFKMTRKGKLTTLYNFCSLPGCSDGYSPYAGLVRGTDGNLYGTTYFGGANGDGTVFKITPRGTLKTLHCFGVSDGMNPLGGLLQATDGDFYGTTPLGGTNGDGTVFRLSVGLTK